MSLELSMGFFLFALLQHIWILFAHAVRACACVCVFFSQLNTTVEFELFVLIGLARALRSDRSLAAAAAATWIDSFCGTYKYVPHAPQFTRHSKRAWARERAPACVSLPQRSLLLFPLCVGKARAFFVCVCVCAWKFTCLLLRCCCRRHRRRRCSRLRFYYKNERKSNTLASERGASASVMRASRTQRKQNIKFKGKQRLWDRQGEAERKASRGRASRRRRHCCCSLLRSLASQLASFRHNSIFAAAFTCSLLCLLFTLLLLLRCSAAASELCAA